MHTILKIGTRESQLAVWQASQVKELLARQHIDSQLVFIKSEGDLDLITPLYEMNVQGVFTRALDTALLNGRIDLAVHSMKDMPTQLAQGLVQTAVLKRGSWKDLFVPHEHFPLDKLALLAEQPIPHAPLQIATSSIRRKSQWLHRFPADLLENLRGNVNTRLSKLQKSNWAGAIFAAAGLERLGLRPESAWELDWMLPAPSQGAISVMCREKDRETINACILMNDPATELCTKIEKDFLRALLGGCSTPIGALAELNEGIVRFRGNILSPDGQQKLEIDKRLPESQVAELGTQAAKELLDKGAGAITEKIRHAAK
jgi:hydroxymethylbilane synthase